MGDKMGWLKGLCHGFLVPFWKAKRYICSLCSVIVRVNVVLKRTVGDSDWRFDNLRGRHLQSHCDIVPQETYKKWPILLTIAIFVRWNC